MQARRLSNRQMGFESLEARFALSAASGLSMVAVHSEAAHHASTPAVVEPSAKVAPIASAAVNWSGYAVSSSADSVSYVAGSWIEPAVNSKQTGYSAIWVGIDGYTSSTVEQIGTEADVVNGQVMHYAWYEMYPSDSVTIPNFTVKAGDSISASTLYDSTHNNFTLTISDTTESETYTTTQSATGAVRSSAEWIVEAPSTSQEILPLTNFGSVTISNAYATINGTTGAIDNWQANSITMATSSRGRTLTEASVSSLSDYAAKSPLATAIPLKTYAGDVSSFTVKWNAAIVDNPTPPPSGWGGLRARNGR